MNKTKKNFFDAVVIGGGFYGSVVALFLKNRFKKVLIIEKESDLLLRASYNNQARIHNGYHYPRSFITAVRSNANYSRFISDFKEAVTDKYLMIYAIASNNTKTTSSQFERFCRQIGSPITRASKEIKQLFNDNLIEDVFIVEEKVFNARKLRNILKKKLKKERVKIFYEKEVIKVRAVKKLVKLDLANGDIIAAGLVINCAYSNINTILKASSLPTLPLKKESAEMPLVKLPRELSKMGITIMDGPFFSVMPFPDKKMHTFHHVRYTPHNFNLDTSEDVAFNKSNYLYMIKDMQRYVPLLGHSKYKGSLYETKTVLAQNEVTDARPILFRKDYGIENFHIILGGKIDNIYDIIEKLTLI